MVWFVQQNAGTGLPGWLGSPRPLLRRPAATQALSGWCFAGDYATGDCAFLANDRYELHLHRLRQTLKSNCLRYQQTIRASFPVGTRISEPQGSFSLWLELDPAIDTVSLCEDLLTQKISIMPGTLFSLQPQYTNCLRLSYGMPYDQRVEAGLQQIGQLVSQYSSS